MSSNDALVSLVTEQLLWDPRVDSAAIGVSADDGRVTLRGTVGSLREKQEAATTVAQTFGVVSVRNELRVRPLDDYR
jgi:osmotically-inducible protein OsmY